MDFATRRGISESLTFNLRIPLLHDHTDTHKGRLYAQSHVLGTPGSSHRRRRLDTRR